MKSRGVVQLTEGHCKSVWLHYTLQTTANKGLKRTGGSIGVTMRIQALVRRFLARLITAVYAADFKKCTGTKKSQHDEPFTRKGQGF